MQLLFNGRQLAAQAVGHRANFRRAILTLTGHKILQLTAQFADPLHAGLNLVKFRLYLPQEFELRFIIRLRHFVIGIRLHRERQLYGVGTHLHPGPVIARRRQDARRRSVPEDHALRPFGSRIGQVPDEAVLAVHEVDLILLAFGGEGARDLATAIEDGDGSLCAVGYP